jgi:hypothetical protein
MYITRQKCVLWSDLHSTAALITYGREQGDQIGRIFAHWVTIYSGYIVYITEVAHILNYFFQRLMLPMYKFWQEKMGWATFWEILSQTQLEVTGREAPLHPVTYLNGLG